jgi:hypothetical protein
MLARQEVQRRTCAETGGDIGLMALSSVSAATIEGDQRPPFSIDSKKGMARCGGSEAGCKRRRVS